LKPTLPSTFFSFCFWKPKRAGELPIYLIKEYKSNSNSLLNITGKSIVLPSLKTKCQVKKEAFSNSLLFGLGKLKIGGPHVLIFCGVGAGATPLHLARR